MHPTSTYAVVVSIRGLVQGRICIRPYSLIYHSSFTIHYSLFGFIVGGFVLSVCGAEVGFVVEQD